MDGDGAWKWICRTLGVVGFIGLVLNESGYNVPKWFYFLLMALLFGPEIFAQILRAIRGKNGNGR